MARSWVKSVVSVLSAAALGALATSADARVDGSSSYSKAQTYSAALRYVRVDLGYEVVEKDPEAAYLIFKFAAPGGGKDTSATGTLEVVDAGGTVRLFVSLPRVPEYQERVFRDGLLKKLRDEYGPPPPIVKKPPPTDQPPAEKKPDTPAAPTGN